MYIGIHGSKVPDWLQKIEPTPGFDNQGKGAKLTFKGIAIVTSDGDAFHVRNLLTEASFVASGAPHMTIQGKSPKGGSGGVIINCRPIVGRLEWFALGVALGVLLALQKGQP